MPSSALHLAKGGELSDVSFLVRTLCMPWASGVVVGGTGKRALTALVERAHGRLVLDVRGASRREALTVTANAAVPAFEDRLLRASPLPLWLQIARPGLVQPRRRRRGG